MTSASQVLLSTVNDILDFSKLEAGQVEIDLRPVKPVTLFEDVVQLVQPMADAKGVALRFHADAEVPDTAWMDDTRVRQVLLNLTSNAVKFTETGEVDVHMSYLLDTGAIRCEVNDTGPGIPPDRLDRLFRRFSQVDGSTARSHGGSGIGLAICKGLVEAMGGGVGVRSVVGEGCCFWFELPCQAATTTMLRPLAPEEETGGFPTLDGLRLLVVDDNAMNRELVRLLMEAMGVHVSEACNGQEGIAAAEQTPFDVILMDIRMPVLAGPDAARAIRLSEGPNHLTPIVAFTADAESSDIPPVWRDVFDDMIGKPLAPNQLFEVLSRWAPGVSPAAIVSAPQTGADVARNRSAGL